MKILYRPVGLTEMKLILDLNLVGFPPRLPEQPIFYPVLNRPYAEQIAKEWNTKDKFSGYVGFVTEFYVSSPFIDKFEEQVVGAGHHRELWIPAEEMNQLNNNILGPIQLVEVHYGSNYIGSAPELSMFEDKNPIEQFNIWKNIYESNTMDFHREIIEHWKYIFMNYQYWYDADYSKYGITTEKKNEVLVAMQDYWKEQFPKINLFVRK